MQANDYREMTKKWLRYNIENVAMILIIYFGMNQILELNNPQGVYIPLNK